MSANDIARLRWDLVLLAIAGIAGIAMVLTARHLVGEAESAQRQFAAQQREIRGRIARAHDEEQEMRGRIAIYKQLLERGVIGREERLDWVEQIGRIRKARRLLDLQYELSPQRALDDRVLPGSAQTGGYEFMASTMRLKMLLLHEDDLLGFLSDLGKAVHARLMARECMIERAPAATSEQGLPAQLRADCTIEWITLRETRQ